MADKKCALCGNNCGPYGLLCDSCGKPKETVKEVDLSNEVPHFKHECKLCGRTLRDSDVPGLCTRCSINVMYNKGQYPGEQTLPTPKTSQDTPRAVVEGVGSDAPTVVNERGGKQSKVLYRYDLLDPQAMFEMTKVLSEGAEKYGEDNWRSISIRDHLNHMIIHAYAYLAGDESDEHLSHIMCRAMFAQAVEIQEKEMEDDEE